jgi:amino acid adenylation domain-containing protein
MENTINGFKISSQQKSLYLLQSHNPDFQYISHCAISIHGYLQTALLKSAIENIFQSHEILRTEFPCLSGMTLPVQIINDTVNLSIEEIDLSNLDANLQEQQILKILKNPISVNFDLAKLPLHQILIIHLSAIEHILIINLSSLCADTGSLKNIFREISNYYSNSHTADEILQYADFCEYQYQVIAEQEAKLADIKAYWQKYDIPTLFNLRLAGEKLQRNQSDFQPQFISWSVDKILQQKIKDVAKNHNINISQILLTCWHILLTCLTGKSELVIGYNCDGRNYEELDLAIGLFNKTVPIYIISEKNHTFTEILGEVNQSTELCQSWQDAFEWEKVFGNSGYCPFSFEFTEINPTDDRNRELEFSLTQIYSYGDKFKLKLVGLLTTDGLRLTIHYDSNCFTESQIQICQQHLAKLLENTLRFPAKAIRELDIISEIEDQQLRDFNDLQGKCFHQLFAELAEKTPDEIAIVYQNQQLTYSELNQRANQLAHHLQKLGVTSEVLVGLCLERSLESVIGILGILKAGGAYVALDPKYPQERITFIVAETQLSIVLTQENLVNKLPQLEAELVCIDTDWKNIAQESQDNPLNQETLEDLAYVIYTSGSTGKPKGVQIPHRNISEYVQAMSTVFELESKDNYLHTASFSFSSSVRQLMVPLSQGATVVIAAIEQIQTPLVLFELIQHRQITIIDLVPSYWRTCTELLESLTTEARNQILDNQLRLIVSASEPLLSDIPKKWRLEFNQDVSFINMYGQTETTGIVCVYPIPDEYEDKITIVPIGRPIATTEIYLLDEQLSPVPVGEVGEMYISGSSLARSYFNRPDLTNEKFIPHPFNYRPEARLYKAGDLARRLPDGTIKFVSRADYQVKIRGQRVEVGEIESIIALYPGVKQTIVMGRDVSGDQRLVAYIVPKLVSNQETSQTISIRKLRNHLKEKLPEYMVPATFLILSAFPLTPTGKIDRRALPAPEDVKQELEETFVPPRNELELELAKIWEQVLGVHPIGINNNFFELGGHSLLAIQVIARITQNFQVNLSLRQLFATPTIESLSIWIGSNSSLEPQVTANEIKYVSRVSRHNHIPLSANQKGLWFLWQLNPENNAYNIHNSYRLEGELDTVALSESWIKVVEKHENLRAVFGTLKGENIQSIYQPEKIELPIVDLQYLPVNEQEKVVSELQDEIIAEPFDLTVYPLWRVNLIKLSPTDHLLSITLHHIIFDDWSWDILLGDLGSLYREFLVKKTMKSVDLPIHYADFAHWQQEYLQGENSEQLFHYWQQQLAGIEPVLNLPTDKPRPAEIGFIGAIETVKLSQSLSTAIKEFSRKHGVTLFMSLLAAFEILLYRYSGQTDIVIGSPIAGRNREELERLIGFFVNTIVLRNDLVGNPSFVELLAKVKETTLTAYEYQDLSFDQLVQKLNPERSLNYHPIFQVMFAWQNTGGRSLEIPGLNITRIPRKIKIAKFDLTLELAETDTGISGFFEYRTDLFDSATIKRMTGHFQTLLEAIVASPQTPIANLPLLTPEEQQQLLLDWNNTTVEYPEYKCIHQLIEQQVQLTPDAIALIWENQQLTYQELNTQANQIAHYLRSLDVQPEVRVGICVERSLEMIIGILAILKAGGAYLPLDPAYPTERLEFMLSDAQVPIILTKSALADTLPHHQAKIICLDTDKSIFTQQSPENPSHQTRPHNLSYIIYTSGSTGQPKGTMIEHRSLINAYLAWEDAYHLRDQTSSHLQMASFSFDVFSGDFIRALCSGAKLVICPRDFLLDPQQLYRLMQQEKIDCAEFVPAVLKNLIEYLEQTQQNLGFMKLLVAGSDSWYLSEYKHIRNFCSDKTRLINSYGVSEATIDTTYFETEIVDLANDRLTPIGRPFANNQIYLLDDHKQPVPIGVSGELYIGGAGLARGYFNRPDLTADKFITNPFADYFPHNQDQRLYKTNDKARYLADGNIEFLGRLDNQVKIRGFRIELGEIESLLNQHPQIKESIVIVREDIPGDKRIVSYLVFQPDAQVSDSELRDYLNQKLPKHFIPSAYVSLDIFPLTPNGKIDRKALPVPEYNLVTDDNFVAPITPTETVLAAIWSQILGIERISINDNFFALGGHSLLVIQVINAITQELSIEISVRQFFQIATLAELAVIIDSSPKNSQPSTIVIIPQRINRDSAVLSFSQQRLWFLEQLEPGRADYHISSSYRFLGDLNIPVLEKSLSTIVARHEILRTNYINEDGNPIQVISAARSLELPIFNIENQSLSQQEQDIKKLLSQERQRPFNFSQDLMLRSCLLKISNTEYILLLVVHHIAADGLSMGIFCQELNSLYREFSQNLPSSLPELPIQYADFAQWQRQYLQDNVLDDSINYWKKHLAGAPELLSLPTDRPRPAVQTYRGSTKSLILSSQITEGIRLLSQREKSTLFMTMLAAFNTLLYRYTSSEDIVIGAALGNRNQKETEGLIGFFVNSLALRTDISGNPSFTELLRRVREVSLGAYEYQDLPFEKLVEVLQPKRDLSYSPIFQVMLVLNEDISLENIELPGLNTSPLQVERNTSQFDLSLQVDNFGTELLLEWEYNTDLFDDGTITRMCGHFQTLLEAIVANPETPIANLPLLTPEEQQQLLLDWNNTTVAYPEYKCIHQLIEQQVQLTPNAIALTYENQQLTYQELNTQANQIAHYLRSLGIQPEDKVGIYVERSLEMIVGILAILKAGGAYLPLDPAYPSERLKFKLNDAQVPVILTKSALLETLPHHQAQVICLDTDKYIFTQQTPENPSHQTQPHNLAYIIYTSGSTGKPKGTMIEHRSLINAYLAWEDAYHLRDQTSSHLQMASFSFDVCSGDFIRALCSGAKLVICPRDFLLDPQQLYKLMQQEKIDCAEFVPAVLKNLIEYLEQTQQNLGFMKLLVAGSDSWYLSEYKHIRNFCSDRTSYGVSEATIDTTYFETEIVDLSNDRLTPIGRPFANNQIYLLDDNQQPVPIGVPGELYIGGAGLARGYFNRPDLTTDKFIPNPFADYFPHNQDQRLYKTNDKARYLADGNIEFLGRLDNQVKIRGFRIELGEIESLLNQHPQIKESIVIVREDVPGDKRIVAYLVFKPENQVSDSELRDYLNQKLPNYFIPSAYVGLDTFPLTPNGKIDRKALPIPEYKLLTDDNFVAPVTPIETVLANIWSQVLGLERVSVNDNFFDLGGHSLLMSQVINKVSKLLQQQLSILELFQYPTIFTLSQYLSDQTQEEIQINQNKSRQKEIERRNIENRDSAPLSFAQQRVWFLEKLGSNQSGYHISSIMHLTGDLNLTILQQSLDAIVVHHQVLRTNFISENGNPLQVIGVPRPVELLIFNLQDHPPSQKEEEVEKLLRQEKEKPFDLGQDLMLRGSLLQLAPQEHILILVMHHIASDGWSEEIIWRDLSVIYEAFLNNQSYPLPELPIQYADFAIWQQQWLSEQEPEKQLQYWKDHLADANPILELPTDYPRPRVQTYQGASTYLRLSSSLTASLRAISRQEEVTLFMTLLATFQTLLYRYSGQEDFMVGSPIAGRNQTEVEDLIGFFISTIVLRANLSGNPSFRELLGRVRQVALDAYNNQDIPFEKLVEELQVKRDLSRNPLFQVWFNMLNYDKKNLVLPGLTAEPISMPSVNSMFDLSLYVEEQSQSIELELVYNTDLFTPERMREMLCQFEALLTQIVAAPEKSIHAYSLVTANSQFLLPNPREILPQPEYLPITNIFADWATRTPQQPAIIQNGQIWTYQELAQASREISTILTTKIQKGDVVAVSGVRSLGFIASMLGVLASGGVLLNIDPNLPTNRKELMLSISEAKVLLFVGDEKEIWEHSLETIYIAANTGKSSLDIPIIATNVEISPEDAAYIFFTSGTTGTPKGVLGSHKGLSHFLHWQRSTFTVTPQDRVAQLTGLSFDVVLRDIFLPLTSGATLCLPNADSNLSPLQVLPWLEANQISLMHTVPTLIQSWLVDLPTGISLRSLRILFSAGEPLTDALVKQWRYHFPESGDIVNLYGPTETTLAKCYYIVPTSPLSGVQPVGSPLPQTQALIVTPEDQLCGIGESGEIVFRTPFRSQGYINGDSGQLSKFVKNPWGDDDTDLLYYTGDRGRYRLDGTLEILGRIDQQVKIRGVRIEPEEISATINQNPLIKASVVIPREDIPGDKKLVAYVVANGGQLNTSELRQFLKQRLPDYMIPSAFVTLEALPITANGKINKRALPVPSKYQQQEKTFIAPRNHLEKQLVAIWEKILGVQPISVTDNFFELGGHSLLALRLLSTIEISLGKSLTLAALFTGQTIEELALVLGSEEKSRSSSSLVPIQTSGTKPPLFVIHAVWGNILFYRDLIGYLPPDQPVYGLEAKGLDGKEAPITSMTEMAAYYIEEIRKVQPQGPYFIGGHSLGGIVAFEIAQQLHSQGEKIGILAIFDMTAPVIPTSSSSASNSKLSKLSKLRHFLQLKPTEQLDYLLPRLQWHLTVGKVNIFYKLYLRYVTRSLASLRVIHVAAANKKAQKSYTPSSVYPGTLTLFRAFNDHSEDFDQDREWGWGEITQKVEVYDVPGTHNTAMQEPNVRVMAEKLTVCLQKTQSNSAEDKL